MIVYPNNTEARYRFGKIEELYLAGEGRITKRVLAELATRKIDTLILSERASQFPIWSLPALSLRTGDSGTINCV